MVCEVVVGFVDVTLLLFLVLLQRCCYFWCYDAVVGCVDVVWCCCCCFWLYWRVLLVCCGFTDGSCRCGGPRNLVLQPCLSSPAGEGI